MTFFHLPAGEILRHGNVSPKNTHSVSLGFLERRETRPRFLIDLASSEVPSMVLSTVSVLVVPVCREETICKIAKAAKTRE